MKFKKGKVYVNEKTQERMIVIGKIHSITDGTCLLGEIVGTGELIKLVPYTGNIVGWVDYETQKPAKLKCD